MSGKVTWDPATDRKLLLGILKLQNISIDYEAMAKYMSTDDVTCTVSAIQNRISKLKAAAGKEGATGASGGGNGVGTPKPKGSGRSKKKRAAAETADDEEESPTKKAKGKAKCASSDDEGEKEVGAESVVKAEDVDA